jgi:transcription initiation factor IIE alpha subunit
MKKNEIDYLKAVVLKWISTSPKTQKELEDITGIDRRDVRRIIGLLRDDGNLICSGNRGYWIWSGNDADLMRTKLAIMKKGIRTIERARKMGDIPLPRQLTIGELLDSMKEEARA